MLIFNRTLGYVSLEFVCDDGNQWECEWCCVEIQMQMENSLVSNLNHLKCDIDDKNRMLRACVCVCDEYEIKKRRMDQDGNQRQKKMPLNRDLVMVSTTINVALNRFCGGVIYLIAHWCRLSLASPSCILQRLFLYLVFAQSPFSLISLIGLRIVVESRKKEQRGLDLERFAGFVSHCGHKFVHVCDSSEFVCM